MKRAPFFFVLFGFAIFVSACGGSGGGGSTLPARSVGATQQTTGATIHVLIPSANSASSRSRKPAYISPSTATITVGVYTVNGATPSPLPTPLSVTIASSPDCSSVSGGESCTITVTVPVATSVVLQISTWDANGNLLGQSLLGPINTTLATIPVQSVSVGGVPAKILLSPAGLAAGDDGSTHTIAFAVSAQDAGGNTIIPPGNYPNPIALTISGDTNSALSLSTASVASPGPTNGASTVTLTYNSAIAITQATITATSGSATASIPFAPIIFTPTSAALYLGGTTQSVTVSEAGYAGAFTIPGATSTTATVTCVPTNCTPSSAGGTVTIDIAPGSTTGSETVSVVDANGGFANIPVTVSTTTGGGALVAPSYAIDKYPVPRPSGGPGELYGVTTGSDGVSIWAVDRGDQTLDVIASPSACNASSCSIATIANGLFGSSYYGLQSIVAAPDGNLYVGDVGWSITGDLGGVYQLTGCSAASSSCSAVNAQAMPLATPEAGPMISAPDGNLYVGSEYPDSNCCSGIMYSAIAGCCSFSYFDLPVPTSGSYSVNGLADDASGATQWFTDSGTGNLGFMPIPCVGGCSLTELPADTSQCQQCGARHRTPILHAGNVGKKIVHPYKQQRVRYILANPPQLSTALNGIVSGPDGYLYVADAGNHAIDQIDPTVWDGASSGSYTPCTSTCSYTPIPLPQTSGIPMNLTVGPDGNIWFTDTTGYVGFVSLTACASSSGCKAFEYHVGGTPWGIAAGSDGDIWFTLSSYDSSNNSIGKVVLP
jgi:hypothetical protein